MIIELRRQHNSQSLSHKMCFIFLHKFCSKHFFTMTNYVIPYYLLLILGNLAVITMP
jgi:hypothetical protein